ncbi:hypothetical protein PPL_12608 [Heterostelium album PN500]|uniref:Tubulin-tyrosine ligase family protein n=1 Tax=Heterostelium pallidum (strain ATCC 26659 / Pp 5 / PN500) TaxID=670386 RepID=D3BN31_HETP5|nr:hypothetical protein PPL_12608 [Heterostelium album PN500]EFA77393.1 hypothetical protein PPL_12608 [Heterostelium album PN500]|eukprot:XP_020429522.1 hypothetical protein PPL_12608 [Heterostelium album PN500]
MKYILYSIILSLLFLSVISVDVERVSNADVDLNVNSDYKEVVEQPLDVVTESNSHIKKYSSLLKDIDLNDEQKLIELYGKSKLKSVAVIKNSSLVASKNNIMMVSSSGSRKAYNKKMSGTKPNLKNLIDFTEEQIAAQWENRNLLNEVFEERFFRQLYSIDELIDLKFNNKNVIDLIWLRIPLPIVENDDYPLDLYRNVEKNHQINRYPLMAQEINAKHSLAKNIREMSKRFSAEEFSFHPTTFILPEDFESLKQYSLDNPDVQFIMKPKFGGRGTGIHLYANANQIENDPNYVVQNYITNPFLIDGKKFTCRLYVLVTSLDPLIIYIHNNGVIKFATTEFNTDKTTFNDENMSMHITNQAVNSGKSNFAFSTDINVDDIGSRWSLKAFWRYLDNNNIYSSTLLWKNIKDVVVKSIFSVEQSVLEKTKELMKSESSVFQLLGVDVDLLDNFQPIFIEANTNPQLGGSKAPFDNYNKLELIRETFDLIGHTIYNSTAMKEDIKSKLLQQRTQSDDNDLSKTDIGIMSTVDIDPLQFKTIKQIDEQSLQKLVQFEFEMLHRYVKSDAKDY